MKPRVIIVHSTDDCMYCGYKQSGEVRPDDN